MTMELTPHDRIIRGSSFVSMVIKARSYRANKDTVDGSQSEYVELYKQRILFQFPPKVAADSKGCNWMEIDYKHPEPFALFMGGRPRLIRMKWFYITGAVGWGVQEVAAQVKNLRKYFYHKVGDEMVIEFAAYNVVGPGRINNRLETFTFRAEDVDISHSDTMIADNLGDDDTYYTAGIYPLRTDVSLGLKLYTKADAAANDDEEFQSVSVSGGSGNTVQTIQTPDGQSVLRSLSDLTSGWY